MIINKLSEISCPPIFFHLEDFILQSNLYIKLEGLNIAGSIKLTTARALVKGVIESDAFSSQTKIIESSSGNLGVALSIVCKENQIPFICVTDPNISIKNKELLEFYDADVISVNSLDERGGYLGTRLAVIHQKLKCDPNYIWTNQYANPLNPAAHYAKTAPEILEHIPQVDYLFIGAGTTGTLMGCARYFKENSPKTRIIAVDAVGSVTFSNTPKKRHIPGLGTSVCPPIAKTDDIDQIIFIEEIETVEMCHYFYKKFGLSLGGSSGTVLSAVSKYAQNIIPDSTVVALSADFGEKYIDTVYNREWVERTYEYENVAAKKT